VLWLTVVEHRSPAVAARAAASWPEVARRRSCNNSSSVCNSAVVVRAEHQRTSRRSSIKSLLYSARHCRGRRQYSVTSRNKRRRHSWRHRRILAADAESIRPSVNRPIVRRRSRRRQISARPSSKSTGLFVTHARADELHRVNIAPTGWQPGGAERTVNRRYRFFYWSCFIYSSLIHHIASKQLYNTI